MRAHAHMRDWLHCMHCIPTSASVRHGPHGPPESNTTTKAFVNNGNDGFCAWAANTFDKADQYYEVEEALPSREPQRSLFAICTQKMLMDAVWVWWQWRCLTFAPFVCAVLFCVFPWPLRFTIQIKTYSMRWKLSSNNGAFWWNRTHQFVLLKVPECIVIWQWPCCVHTFGVMGLKRRGFKTVAAAGCWPFALSPLVYVNSSVEFSNAKTY